MITGSCILIIVVTAEEYVRLSIVVKVMLILTLRRFSSSDYKISAIRVNDVFLKSVESRFPGCNSIDRRSIQLIKMPGVDLSVVFNLHVMVC